MLLHHLFTHIPSTMLEKHGVMPRAGSIPHFDPRMSKVVGLMDGEQVWASRCFTDLMSLGIQSNGKCVAFVNFYVEEVEPNTHVMHQMWCDPELAGVGLASALLVFILVKLKLKLVVPADDVMTKSGRNAILKLHKAHRVRVSNQLGLLTDQDVERILMDPLNNPDTIFLHELHSSFGRFLDSKNERDTWFLILGNGHDID